MVWGRTALAATAVALIAANCGGGAAGPVAAAQPGTKHQRHEQPPAHQPDTSGGSAVTLESATVLGADIGDEMRAYLRALQPARREVRQANRAADHEASIASSGDFPALAADSRSVQLHLARAAAAARRVRPPKGLEEAHSDLVRAFTVGGRMAGRLAALYDHIGPGSDREYAHRVVPLEKRALRLGNRWYSVASPAMVVAEVREPSWIDHLFDWS